MNAPKRRRTAAFYKPGKYDCANCRRDVRGETHVRHREREHFVLCTDCYSIGAEGVSGVRWNADNVQLIDTSTTRMPLLVDDWSAEHEVRLLEGLLQFGFGNWRAIAEHLGFEKTEQECEEHYERFYLRSKTFPLPDLARGPVPAAPPAAAPSTAEPGGAETGGADRGASPVPDAPSGGGGSPHHDVAMTDASDAGAGAAAPATAATDTHGAHGTTAGSGTGTSGSAAVGASSGGSKNAIKPIRPKKETRGASGLIIEGNETPAADLVGYMPLRGEFDTEWENDAEYAIADIEFNAEDTEAEEESKLALLREYNRALDERQRRRDFVQRHDLIERAARQHTLDRKRTIEERTFRAAMRPYAPHTSPEEHEDLVTDLLREAMLRKRAEHLLACKAAELSAAQAELVWERRIVEELAATKSQAAAHSGGAAAALAPPAAGTAMTAIVPVGAGSLASVHSSSAFMSDGGMDAKAKAAAAAKAKAVAKAAAASSHIEAQALLNAAEMKACAAMGLRANQYIAGKRQLLPEGARRGGLSLSEAREILKAKLDAHRAKLLWQHCVGAGWLVAKKS